MPITRSKSKAHGLDGQSERSSGSSASSTPIKVEGEESIDTSDTRIDPGAIEGLAPFETPEPAADHDQADPFHFPEWVEYYDHDQICKELALNIQKAARMQARAREIRAQLSQPESRAIVNLIEELNRLESDPLRPELDSIMEKLQAVSREFDSTIGKLYPVKRQFDFAKRLMENFGLGVAPTTPSRGGSQNTPAVSPSAVPITSPAVGAGCRSAPVEHSAARPAMTPVITAAPYSPELSQSPQVAHALANRVEAAQGSTASKAQATAPAPRQDMATKRTGRKLHKAKSSQKMAKGSVHLSSRSSWEDPKEHSNQPQLHSKTGEGLAVSDGGNTPTKKDARKSGKAQGTQSEPDKDDGAVSSQDDIDEDKPCEPVYNPQPGESSYNAQVRYINEFQQYQKKMAAYRKRTKGRLARELDRASEQPSEEPSTPAKRPRRV